MAKYESLPTSPVTADQLTLPSCKLPELVHMEDPANTVMIDYSHMPAFTISSDKNMEEALNEMRATDSHMLIVADHNNCLAGVISSEDLLGEKPIQIIQEGRVSRQQILVKMLMTPVDDIIALQSHTLTDAKVGNIVKTLTDHKQHYALVIDSEKQPNIRGLFTLSQISKQLHMSLENAVKKAESLSELQQGHH